MLGFEIEMLVLVDVDGRPVPEKIPLGTYGTQQIMLTIDHSSQVEAFAPVPAARAQRRLVPYRNDGIRLGQYDLPDGYESRLVIGSGQGDPRTDAGFTALSYKWLSPEGWRVAEQALCVDGVPPWQDEVVRAVDDYRVALQNGDVAGMLSALNIVQTRAAQWLGVSRPIPTDDHKRRQLAIATEGITGLRNEVAAHHTYWTTTNAMPAGERQYRAVGSGTTGAWTDEHPVEHFLGRETYHSILELVTRPYAIEAPAEAQSLLIAMNEAHQLANWVVNATTRLAQRTQLNAPNATVTNAAQTHIGNAASPRQMVDASIQVTFAVDLGQIPSLFKTVIPTFGGEVFALKHQSDAGGTSAITSDTLQKALPITIYRAKSEAGRAPIVATAILKSLASGEELAQPGGLVELRGLLTLVCQYLLMGKHFYSGALALDKNIVPLLSRTDLAHIYRDLVGDRDKEWVVNHRSPLVAAILARCMRRYDSFLFTDSSEQWRGVNRPPLNVTCQEFVENVLNGQADGVTHHLDEGIFKEMPAEEIHPAGSPLAGAPRRGPVFELRNMIPLENAGLDEDRFPSDQWAGLAGHLIHVLQTLNLRTDDPAVDIRWFQNKVVPESKRWWE